MLIFRKILIWYFVITVPLITAVSSMASILFFNKAYAQDSSTGPSGNYPPSNVSVYTSRGGFLPGDRVWDCRVYLKISAPEDIDKLGHSRWAKYRVTLKDSDGKTLRTELIDMPAKHDQVWGNVGDVGCNKSYQYEIETLYNKDVKGKYTGQFKVDPHDIEFTGNGECAFKGLVGLHYMPEPPEVKPELWLALWAEKKDDYFVEIWVNNRKLVNERASLNERDPANPNDNAKIFDPDKLHTQGLDSATFKIQLSKYDEKGDPGKACASTEVNVEGPGIPDDSGESTGDSANKPTSSSLCAACDDIVKWKWSYLWSFGIALGLDLFSMMLCKVACWLFLGLAYILNGIVNLLMKVIGIETDIKK